MLTLPVLASFAAGFLSLVALALAVVAVRRASACKTVCEVLLPLKEKFDNFDESIVRSVMEEGGEASVEAVLQTMGRLMKMDDGTLDAAEALKQAREMHKR